jgi:hypothetical protein
MEQARRLRLCESKIGSTRIREPIALTSEGRSFPGSFTIHQQDQAGNLLVHLPVRSHGDAYLGRNSRERSLLIPGLLDLSRVCFYTGEKPNLFPPCFLFGLSVACNTAKPWRAGMTVGPSSRRGVSEWRSRPSISCVSRYLKSCAIPRSEPVHFPASAADDPRRLELYT